MLTDYNGHLWTAPSEFTVITTNGTVKKDGRLVMGRGCALQARDLLPGIDKALGQLVSQGGNRTYFLARPYNIFAFPVKNQFHETASLDLINLAAESLARFVETQYNDQTVIAMPRPGCGNGGLRWDQVQPILEEHLGSLDSEFIVCHLSPSMPKLSDEQLSMRRVLVTGDRKFSDLNTIKNVLTEALPDPTEERVVLVHGDAKGADTLAGKVAAELGHDVLACPAPWDFLGKAAGMWRNRYMLDMNPEIVIGFHYDIENSKGTKGCLEEANKRGIKNVLVSQPYHPKGGD